MARAPRLSRPSPGTPPAVGTLNIYAPWPDSEDRTRAAVDGLLGHPVPDAPAARVVVEAVL